MQRGSSFASTKGHGNKPKWGLILKPISYRGSPLGLCHSPFPLKRPMWDFPLICGILCMSLSFKPYKMLPVQRRTQARGWPYPSFKLAIDTHPEQCAPSTLVSHHFEPSHGVHHAAPPAGQLHDQLWYHSWRDLRRKPISMKGHDDKPISSFILKSIGCERDSALGLYHSSLKIPKWNSLLMWYPHEASIWKLVGYTSSLEFVVPFERRVVW